MTWTTEGIHPDPLYKGADEHSGLVEPSLHMRQSLAEAGSPVIVAFSRGKDSICAMISLLEAGVQVIPVHLYRVPGLKFEDESLQYFEDFFQMKIWNLPHRDFWYYLCQGVYTAPWQSAIVEAAGLSEMPHEVMWAEFREEMGLPSDTWVCDGIRSADSIMRRTSIKKHGPWTRGSKKFEGEMYPDFLAHVVWDWKIKDIRRCLELNGVKLPRDYDMFGRTFDGLDYRFLWPMKEKAPEDFKTLCGWFPACEMDIMRHEFLPTSKETEAL